MSLTRPAAVTAVLLLAACVPVRRPQVKLEPGVSLHQYHQLEVAPLSDETGYGLALNVTHSLTVTLEERLREHRLVVVDSTSDRAEPTLRIESALTGLRAQLPRQVTFPAMPGSRCTVRAVLTDRHNGRRVGEMVASEIVDPDWNQLTLLALMGACVRMIADEIARQIQEGA